MVRAALIVTAALAFSREGECPGEEREREASLLDEEQESVTVMPTSTTSSHFLIALPCSLFSL